MRFRKDGTMGRLVLSSLGARAEAKRLGSDINPVDVK